MVSKETVLRERGCAMAFLGKSISMMLLVVLCGCATITRGTKEVLVVESEPVGAKVTTSLGLVGTTPATFKVSRKGGFTVTIEKEGYEPVTVQIASQVAGAGAAGMAGNIILGGLIGAAIDAGSGAMKQLKPNPVKVTLVPLAPLDEEPEVSDVSEDDAAEAQESEGDAEDTEPEEEEPGESLSFRIDFGPLSCEEMFVAVTQVG